LWPTTVRPERTRSRTCANGRAAWPTSCAGKAAIFAFNYARFEAKRVLDALVARRVTTLAAEYRLAADGGWRDHGPRLKPRVRSKIRRCDQIADAVKGLSRHVSLRGAAAGVHPSQF
jgi:hypothetical protein